MKFTLRLIVGASIICSLALPAAALNTGNDLLVPAAGRSGVWVTDLYILNPGNQTVGVSVFWLTRNQVNENPMQLDYSLAAGQTLSLEDVISTGFGLASAGGAFHITADGEILVNSRIYSQDGDETFGQGFEGIPMELATTAGNDTDIVGLSFNDSFRTNIYGCAGADGATISFSLRALDGTEIASTTKTLRAWEPFLQNANTFLGIDSFDDGTLHVSVTAGAAVVGASKVDNESTDPTTLESSVECSSGGGDAEGDVQMAFYDSYNYATGGRMTIEDGSLTMLDATYTNWDKVDGEGNPSCKWIFLFGPGLSGTPTLAELEQGVTIEADYSSSDLGTITYTLKLTASGNGYTGTLDAVGANFPADVDGCNGTFPQQVVAAGILPSTSKKQARRTPVVTARHP